MAGAVDRRRFLASLTAPLAWPASSPAFAAEFPVRFRKASPYQALLPFVEPGSDEFAVEKEAAGIEAELRRMRSTRTLPLDSGFRGASPMPLRYRIRAGIAQAEFGAKEDFLSGLRKWLDSLGDIRRMDFYALSGGRIRYEVASSGAGGLQYRTGSWRARWRDGKLTSFAPLEETLVTSPKALFEDVTGQLFGETPSFQEQLTRGVPYWRSRLDLASGITVFGNNGIAVGDADGDGWDEVYVCQPGGLPNRLYRRAANGGWQDVTERAGVGVLDDTASALFLDLRNQGVQDLIVLTTSMPMLFLNDGRGRYRYGADAFRFARPPSGSFAGMAAADFDRDGKLDLYLCSYLYFQGEDQYRYPSPYHDAETGPPNFLFRNRLNADGSGSFEDVTAEAGLDQNNSRYSFAASWCDYDGDGWPDLYVANDFGRNNLYQNDGGKFRDVAREAGVEDLGPGMSAAWFDYDRDGRPDLYVANMWTPAGQRVAADPAFGPVKAGLDPKAYHGHTKGNSLFRNLGGGAFEYTAGREGVEMGRWAWSADGIDFDLDGTPEIYIASGMITHSPGKDLMSFFWRQVVAKSPAERKAAPDYENGWNCLNQLIREDWSWNGNEPNVFYVRKGDRFYDYSGVSGLDVAADSRAFAATDFDGDGALDLFVKNRLGPQILALRNRSWEGRKVIVLELEGKRSNRDGIGARVEVEHESGRVAQWLAAGSGYISQHTKRLHFGLDRSSVAHAVKVRWPSGLEQEFRGLAAGFRYRIVEGSSQLRRVPLSAPAPVSKPVAPVEPVNDLVVEPTWLLDPAPLPEERRGTGFLCLTSGDPGARPAGVPLEVLDLQKAPPETAAAYALLRRYLFDYRAPLRLPWLLLIDEQGQIHKVYPSIPDAAVLRRDLALMRGPDRTSLALPFAGQYYSRPGRNYLRLGSPFLEAGYPEQALFYLKAAIRREPGNFKAQLAVGQIHLEAGRYADARAHLEIAARLNPDSPELWNNFGGLEMAKEDYAAALRYFEKALSIRPDLHFVLANAGQAQARLGNTDAAEKMLLRALELEPTDADTANQLGLLLARRGEFDSAARLFQQAITHQRDHSAAINNLAVLYVRTRKMDDAAAALRYGIQVAPDSETFYFNLARLHADRGDLPRARQVIEELLARKPGHAGARKALAELEQR